MKYFNISPSFSYSEVWGFNEVKQSFDPTQIYVDDTTFFNVEKDSFTIKDKLLFNGRASKDTLNKFGAYRTFNASVGINTQLFGLMQFKKGFAWHKASDTTNSSFSICTQLSKLL